MTSMNRLRVLVTLAAIAVVAGCEDVTVPNYNNPSVDALTSSPTPSVVNTATSGLLVLYRAATAAEGWQMGSLGREAYNLLQAEARNLLGYYAGPIVPGGFVQDLGWSNAYTNLRQIQSILTAVDKVSGYNAAQKEAVKGFVQTIAAMELLRQIKIRDTIGIVVDIPADPHSLGTVVGKDAVLTRIADMLDSARTHLQAGGAAFPFVLTSGFAGFNTPATFTLVNRGMRARVDVYRRQWAQALTDIAASFVTRAQRRWRISRGARTTSGVPHRATRRIRCLIQRRQRSTSIRRSRAAHKDAPTARLICA